mgnify:CR=1 FL=1
MANTVINGTDLTLFTKTGTGSTYNPLAYAKTSTIQISASTLETSSKDSGKWTDKQASKLSWNCSTENLYSEDATNGYSVLFNAMTNRTPVAIAFSTSGTAKGYTGTAIITSLSINAADGENATFSCSLEGTGELISRV